MKTFYINPTVFFLAFHLLLKDEKKSGKKNDLLSAKILGKELSSEQFEKLFKDFRSELHFEGISFYDNYRWFEGDDYVFFAGCPDFETSMSARYNTIHPKFVVKKNSFVLKYGNDQTFEICSICDSRFYNTLQLCWPFVDHEFPFSVVSRSKYLAPQFLAAIKSALQSFES